MSKPKTWRERREEWLIWSAAVGILAIILAFSVALKTIRFVWVLNR